MEELLEPTLILDMDGEIKKTFVIEDAPPSVTIHQGQRKLFLTELRFLTENYDKNRVNIVLYIGAASGQHLGLLSYLFPDVVFILYDGAKFLIKTLPGQEGPVVSKTEDVPRIIKDGIPGMYTIQSYVFLEEAELVKENIGDRKLLLISDIRTASEEDGYVYDDHLLNDLSLQYHWINIMEPDMSMLKFRFPFYQEHREEIVRENITNNEFIKMALPEIDFVDEYYKGGMVYFGGEIWIQAFPGRRSSETRLVTDGKTLQYWGTTERYSGLMYTYNMLVRPRLHVNKYADRNVGFDHCGDCSIEAYLWENYLKDRYEGNDLIGEVRRHFNMLTRASKPILEPPGGHGYLFPIHKKPEQFYNKIRKTGIEERKKSEVYDLRALNNFIKAIMINRVVRRGDTVIDLGGGRGGDLNKFSHANAAMVVLTDISSTSIDEAIKRYDMLKNRNPRIFKAEFIDSDSSDPELKYHLPVSDVVSAQFNLHYVFDTPERIDSTFENISQSLRKGGKLLITIPNSEYILKMVSKSKDGKSFGNRLFNIDFDDPCNDRRYRFYLVDSVDNVYEYLIYEDEILDAASRHDLKLRYNKSFDEIVKKDLRQSERDVMDRMVDNLYKDSKFFPIPKAQWDIFKLYKVMIFDKISDPTLLDEDRVQYDDQ